MPEAIIKKDGTDYPLQTMPLHYPADRVYLHGDINNDAETAIDSKAEIVIFHDTITASDTNIHYLFIDKPRTGDCKCIIPIPFALGANANEYLNVWIQGFNASNTQALIRYQAPTSGTFDLYLAFVY